jgi:hypothetical protein
MSERSKVMMSGLWAALGLPAVTLPAGTLALIALILKAPLLVAAAFAWLAGTAVVCLCRPEFWRRVSRDRLCRRPDLPAEFGLCDAAAGNGLRRLKRARRERDWITRELPQVAGLVSDDRMRACLAELERGCVDLILTVERLGQYLDEHEHQRTGCVELEALRASKAELAGQLTEMLDLLERVGHWLLRLEAKHQALQTARLQDSLETLAAALDSQPGRGAETQQRT